MSIGRDIAYPMTIVARIIIMEDAKDDDCAALENKKNPIRKALGQNATNLGIPPDTPVYVRIGNCPVKGGVDLIEKLLTPSALLVFIPLGRICDVNFGQSANNDPVSHVRSLA